jgi:hypothetical protein
MIRKPTPARMARLVAQWRLSDESRARFARRHHVPSWTFWYWCRKLSADPRAEADETRPTAFVPVRLALEPDASVIEIVCSGGERVQARPGASADLVRAVVTALRSPC